MVERALVNNGRLTKWERLKRDIWQARYIYLLILPGVIYLALFNYQPIYGIILAFKKFVYKEGVMGSPWVGLANFRRLFITPMAVNSIVNTIKISLGRVLFEFPIPIVFAILFNEMRGKKLRRVYQTVYTFPHFLSWLTVITIIRNIFGTYGMINQTMHSFGLERYNFMTDSSFIMPMIFISANWKEMGWSAIIYMAAITGIDPGLYEAAVVDGANRLQRIWHVTLPGIMYTVAVLLILKIGGLMNAGFEQIFYIQNPVTRQATEIIDTYVHYITFMAIPDYGFSTAVGVFKSVINCVLLYVANRVVSRLNGTGLLR